MLKPNSQHPSPPMRGGADIVAAMRNRAGASRVRTVFWVSLWLSWSLHVYDLFFPNYSSLLFSRSQCMARKAQHGGRGLSGVTCQRASARSSCIRGSDPPALLSWPGRSSRRDAATARCAATAKMPPHRKTHAALAAARSGAGTAAARARASNRTSVVAPGAHQPPISIPRTTRRQRRAWPSSGYVWRLLRWAAWAKATTGRDSAPARGCPSRPTGLTVVASTASCAPCQRGSPLQTTSMCRASWIGTSKFMSASRTFFATRAPASLHPASARSRGMAREARTPEAEPGRACRMRAAAAGARSSNTGIVSHQEAEWAACLSAVAERRPRPPKRAGSCAVRRGSPGTGCPQSRGRWLDMLQLRCHAARHSEL